MAMTHTILKLATTDSTNRVAVELAQKGAEPFSAVMADYQTAGRGRLGKSWQSHSGCGLYCSIILRPTVELEILPSITLVIGLVVAETLEKLSGNKVNVLLKWPNDLYVDGKKLGGILVETVKIHASGPSCLVAGIGINLTSSQEQLSLIEDRDATSLLIETGFSVAPESVLGNILEKLPEKIVTFENQGFAPYIERWNSRDYLKNRRVEVVNTAHDIVKGMVVGIDKNGQMRLRDREGVIHAILSGDIRLAQKKAL